METITLSGKHSFQWKPSPLVEAVRFSVNCFFSFHWKPFLQRKALAFSGSNSFQWKLLLLIDGISFIGSYSFYWKLFILVKAISFSFFSQTLCFCSKFLPAVEANPFGRSLFFSVETLWKLFLLIETFPFIGNHSFQYFNIFISRSYQILHEYLNVNDSVRSLRICQFVMYSHFWGSISELRGVFRTQSNIWDRKFLKKLLTVSFRKRAPLQMWDLVLNTPLGLFFYKVYMLLEFQLDH